MPHTMQIRGYWLQLPNAIILLVQVEVWRSRLKLCISPGIPYRVVIIPMKKLSIAMATVNPWVCVSGELGDSGVRQIPKNTQEIYFQVCTRTSSLMSTHWLADWTESWSLLCGRRFSLQCKNLGRLSTLQLGQENSGLLAKCLIDCVMVYNEITGHTYK